MSFCKFYANIVKTERNQACLKLPRRILYSANIVKVECKAKQAWLMPKRILYYSNIIFFVCHIL